MSSFHLKEDMDNTIPRGATPPDSETMCEHNFKGKGLLSGPRHGPTQALDKGCFLGNFGEKGVYFKTI